MSKIEQQLKEIEQNVYSFLSTDNLPEEDIIKLKELLLSLYDKTVIRVAEKRKEYAESVKEEKQKKTLDDEHHGKESEEVLGDTAISMNEIEEIQEARAPLKKIQFNIGLNDRILFIQELFNKNKDQYNKLINDLLNTTEINAAEQILDNTISEYGWDTSDETVQQFLQIIYRGYQLAYKS